MDRHTGIHVVEIQQNMLCVAFDFYVVIGLDGEMEDVQKMLCSLLFLLSLFMCNSSFFGVSRILLGRWFITPQLYIVGKWS